MPLAWRPPPRPGGRLAYIWVALAVVYGLAA